MGPADLHRPALAIADLMFEVERIVLNYFFGLRRQHPMLRDVADVGLVPVEVRCLCHLCVFETVVTVATM